MIQRVFKLLSLAWLAAWFDCGLSPLIELRGCGPSACVLAAALLLALSESPYAFLACGWLGLASDLCGAGRLGVGLACYAIVSFTILRLRSPTDRRTLPRKCSDLIIATFAIPLMTIVWQALLTDPTASWPVLVRHALGVAIYTTICGLPLLLASSLNQQRASTALAPNS